MIQFHPYSIILAVSALITLGVFFIARRRSAAGYLALSWMLFWMFVWGFSYALSWAFVSPEWKIFWLKFMFFGVVLVPCIFLIFTLRITHREDLLTFRNIILLFAEPLIIILCVWFAPELMIKTTSVAIENGLAILRAQRGPMFWVSTAYSYIVIFISFYLLISSYRQANPVFKRQYLLILVGSIVPFVLSLLTQTFSSRLLDFDLSVIAFGLSGIIFAYAILRHRLTDVVPIARSRLIENMSDGVLVLDAQGRIVDVNPAMRNFLDADPLSFIGKDVSEALNIWNESTEHLFSGLETRTELRLPGKTTRYIDLRVSPLYDDDKQLSGRLIIFRDISDRKEVEKDLRFAMDRMQTQLIEIGLLQSQLREQAIRDALTNLFNRRYLEETLERELARAARESYPLCIVMMDIDHFKEVNDTHGHEAGDVVLKTLGETVTRLSRQGDFVCRYGGEEFVLVMPNINIEVARDRAHSVHRAIQALYIPFGRFNLNVTVSMGISCFPLHGEKKEDLLRMADRALYAAKRAGRNRVYVYRESELNTI
jgi:diguanylate cyclase (GGDEF)-like protein/PAS domain S-box-containing protein